MSKIQNALERADEERATRSAADARAEAGTEASPQARAMWQEVRRWETSVVARRSPQSPVAPGRAPHSGGGANVSTPRLETRPADAGPAWDEALRQAQGILVTCEQRMAVARDAAAASAAGVTAHAAIAAQAARELTRLQQAAQHAQEQMQAAERIYEGQRDRVAALQQGQVLAAACRKAEQEAQVAAQLVTHTSQELAHYQARHRDLTTTVDDLRRRLSETLARLQAAPGRTGPATEQHPKGSHG